MSNLKIIENKISAVRRYLKISERYQKYPKAKLLENLDIKGATERYLYLTAQSAIDLAEAVIAYKKFRKPTTMTDAFYILNEEKIIAADLTKKMVEMVGFRNIIAHDYEKVNYDIVYNVLREGLKDIEKFLTKIKKNI